MTPTWYQKLLRNTSNRFRNQQDAEDAVQSTVISLMRAENVDNAEAYAATTAYNYARRQAVLKGRMVYGTSEPEALDETLEGSDPHLRDMLLEGIYSLPKGQQAVIQHVLTGKSLPEMPGDYNTNKHQYLLAVRRLRAYFITKKAI